MTDEHFEALGLLADRLDNALAALAPPLSPQMHIEGMRGVVIQVSSRLKALVIEGSGNDPWEAALASADRQIEGE